MSVYIAVIKAKAVIDGEINDTTRRREICSYNSYLS